MYSRSSDKTLAPFVFGVYPKPIRGHYFRGREEYGGTQRKEDCDMSRELLRKMLIKQNTDKKRGIGWRIRKRRP